MLARQEAIKEKLQTGRTVMSVYRELGSLTGIRYSQFDRYVNKYIRNRPAQKKPAEKKVEETIKTFLENHESTVKKEDII